MKKKIVLISHSTLPSNTPRANRTHELAAELSRQGHEVVLYVVDSDYNYIDYCNEFNVKVKFMGPLRFYTFHPYDGPSLSLMAKIFAKIFGKSFQFPQIELTYHTYNLLRKEDNIDLLITIAVPYPIHWGAAIFKKTHPKSLNNTVWVSDCGDPFSVKHNSRIFPLISYLHNLFYKQTDFLSIPTKEAIKAYPSIYHNKIHIIPQGFDFKTIKDNIQSTENTNTIPTFIYAGTFYSDIRNPKPFLDYLMSIDKEFKFIIYTKSTKILEEYIPKLGEKLEIKSYIPRLDLINAMSKADFLVNFQNKYSHQTPSKLIDYALTGRPILNIDTNIELDTSMIENFINGIYDDSAIVHDLNQYNIKNIAQKFLALTNKQS